MLLKPSEQKTRVRQLLLDPEVPSDLREYLNGSSTSMVAQIEQYISKIEQGQIKIEWSRKIDREATASLAQIYQYPTAFTSQLIQLIEQAIAENPGTSWGGYAWDLAWMSVRVGVENPYGTIVFPAQIGEAFKSFSCTFIPSMGCFVFATLPKF